MIDFKPISLENKKIYAECLADGREHGCEYSFANLYMWGRQNLAFIHEHAVLFSQFNQRTIYPYPVGNGDKKVVLEAIIADAKERGISCRITSLDGEAKETLEKLFPGQFYFHCDRDFFDYVYDINDLADLKGKNYQKKRNHYKRFLATFPEYTTEPISSNNIEAARGMIQKWYEEKLQDNPTGDFLMEQIALEKALAHYEELSMDGLLLKDGDRILAMTMGSFINEDTIDIHFEKALRDADGAYAAINREFATYLRDKYPKLRFLNREDDMGIEGLRLAKQRYFPHHMVEKYWAHLSEEGYEY